MQHVKRLNIILFLLAGRLLSDCVQSQQNLPAQSPCGQDVSCASEQRIAETNYLFSFSAVGLDGKQLDQNDLKGSVVIAQGFASWCSSCAVEAQAIKQVYEKHSTEKLRVLYFDMMPSGESVEKVNAFRDEYGDSSWLWIAQSTELPRILGVRSLDFTAVLDRNGKIVYSDNSFTDANALDSAVSNALRVR